MPNVKRIEYVVDLKRVILRKLKLGIADGSLIADGETIYTATDLKVGLFDAADRGDQQRKVTKAARAERFGSAGRPSDSRVRKVRHASFLAAPLS